LVIVIAVEHFDIHTRVGHPASQLSQLSGDGLFQALDDDLALSDDADAGGLQRSSGGRTIVKEKVGHADAADDPRSASLDADASLAEGFAHVGQGAGAIREFDG
jgi:hypothetical protein